MKNHHGFFVQLFHNIKYFNIRYLIAFFVIIFNVKEGGMEFGVNSEMTYELTSKLRAMTDKLLIMKLSPNVTDIEKIAMSAESGGADAISAVNTFVGMGIDYKTGKILLSTKFGGLSGPAIKPMALAKIHKI